VGGTATAVDHASEGRAGGTLSCKQAIQTVDDPTISAAPIPAIDKRLATIFAIACGAMVANLYYGQALVGVIAPDLGLSERAAGLVVTLTQLGYGAGLLLVVSLADLVENKRLILIMITGAIVGLTGIFLSRSALPFLIFTFMTGFCSVGSQIMIPLAAHLAPEETRGQMIGNIMGGLITGIMLARPIASALAAFAGWRAIFGVSAAIMVALGLLLARALPRRIPPAGLHYGQLLVSTVSLLVGTAIIRRRTAYQMAIFATFNLFWTAVPLLLAKQFGLGQIGIALFALAGAGGALAAPIAGRLGDRGYIRAGTSAALGGAVLAMAAAGWAGAARHLVILALAAVLLDAATQFNQVIGQRVLYSLAAEARGRINAGYMTMVFVGGAFGSALASYTLAIGGWQTTTATGAALMLLALLFHVTDRRSGALTVRPA
jgi:predicted MFS family arabinose efflux permease